MNMEIPDVIGRIFFMRQYRTAGAALARLKVQQDENTPAMRTNGRMLLYNPQFVAGLPLAQLIWMLVHEGWHCELQHAIRFRELLIRCFGGLGPDDPLYPRILLTANYAMDYEINPQIPKREDVVPWPQRLDDPQFYNKAWEEIFWLLWQEQEDEPPPPDPQDQDQDADDDQDSDVSSGGGDADGDDSDTDGGGESGDGGSDFDDRCPTTVDPFPTEDEEELAALKRKDLRELESCAFPGSTPASMDLAIKKMSRPKLDYADILGHFMEEQAPIELTYSRPNRRYSGEVFMRPGLGGLTIGRFIFIGDTSFSMLNLQEKVCGHMLNFCDSYNQLNPGAIEVTALWADTDVYRQDLQPGDKPKPVGGGGTNFSKAMDYVIEHMAELEPIAIVFCTDGEVFGENGWGKDPGIPVLWIATKEFTPPYGVIAAAI